MHGDFDAYRTHRLGALAPRHHGRLRGVWPVGPHQDDGKHGEEPGGGVVIHAKHDDGALLRTRVRRREVPARELRLLREHARERVREIRVVPRALLGVTHHHEHLLARLVEQRRGWRNHGERTSGGEKRDLSKVARERAMRALGRGKRLAVEELQLDVVFPLRDAEVPQRREKRVHLVDRGNQSVRGVLREKHLSAVSRVGHHGDEVYRLAAEDGVMRVPVYALLPRAGLGGVDAHANARTAEDDVAVFVARLREVGHPENLPDQWWVASSSWTHKQNCTA